MFGKGDRLIGTTVEVELDHLLIMNVSTSAHLPHRRIMTTFWQPIHAFRRLYEIGTVDKPTKLSHVFISWVILIH